MPGCWEQYMQYKEQYSHKNQKYETLFLEQYKGYKEIRTVRTMGPVRILVFWSQNVAVLGQGNRTSNLEKFVSEVWWLCSHFYDVEDIDKKNHFLKKPSEFIDFGLVVDMWWTRY